MQEQEIIKLRESGSAQDVIRAEQIEKEIAARNALLTGLKNLDFDDAIVQGMGGLGSGEQLTEQSQALKRMGVDIEGFSRRISSGEDVTGDFVQSLR